MTRRFRNTTVLALSVCMMMVGGCVEYTVDPVPGIDSGSWYETGFRWPHDGQPYESKNFVIYSDGASTEARQLLSDLLEDAFTTITARLELTDLSVLKYPAGRNQKMHIYAYKNYFPPTWGGQAFYGGFLIYSPDHPIRTQAGLTRLETYQPVVRHELMHAIQSLILGANDEKILYCWFSEGIAIEISDDNFYNYIDSQQDLDSLTTIYGMLNPVAVRHSWETPTSPQGVVTFYFYPNYRLAVRYLLDPNGRGGSFAGVRDVLLDAAQDIPFDTSLKNRFGISQQEYEAQFFSLMHSFLP